MYTPAKLNEYLERNHVSWAKPLPENTPPEDILYAEDGEPLFRLTIESGSMTEEDMKPLSELQPNKNWGNKLWKASGLSSMSTEDSALSMQKLPSLKGMKGLAKINMKPGYGVLKATPSPRCANHYTWWHTTLFNLATAEITMKDITQNQNAV